MVFGLGEHISRVQVEVKTFYKTQNHHFHETMTSLYFETFQCALFRFCYMFTFLECNTTKI